MPIGSGESPGSASIALGGAVAWSRHGVDRLAFFVSLQLPVERLTAVRYHHFPTGGPSGGGAQPPQQPSAGSPAPRAVAPPTHMRIDRRVARSCVQAAWRTSALIPPSTLDSMIARARWSAVLPETRVRLARSWDQAFRLSPTEYDPLRTYETTGGRQWLEGRLTWRLDELLFSEQELQVEKLRMQQVQLRARLAAQVLSALFAWQRDRAAAQAPELSDSERQQAQMRAAETEAVLDVLTGGWFGRWLAPEEHVQDR